jgi:hypothetical protein
VVKNFSTPIIFFIVILIFLSSGLALLPDYQYQINPDGVAYITIAKLYQSGQFGLAVNGMRSPLYSWLLVPLLMMGFKPLLAAKMLALCISLAGFWLIKRYLVSLDLERKYFGLVLLALAAIFLWIAYAVVSPDFLIAILLLAYLQSVWKIGKTPGNGAAVWTGIFGGLAYLAKHYAFPFVVVHLAVHMLLLGWRNRRKIGSSRALLRAYVVAMTGFLLISGAWMLIMQQKYGPFVVSYGGDYNFGYMAPGNPGHAVEWVGLVAPPHDAAISIWDDPITLVMPAWRPWDSVASAAHYLNVVRQHFSELLEIGLHFSPLSFAVFLVALWLALSPIARSSPLREISLHSSLAMIIYTAGYLLIMTEERYFWPVQLLLLMAGAAQVGELSRCFPRERVTAALSALVILSFAYIPVQNVVAHRGSGAIYYRQASEIAAAGDFHRARIASNRYWNESLYHAHHLNAKYYGTCAPYHSAEEIRAALEQHKIEYFLFWGQAPSGNYAFLSAFPELLQGKVSGLKVYDLRSWHVQEPGDVLSRR